MRNRLFSLFCFVVGVAVAVTAQDITGGGSLLRDITGICVALDVPAHEVPDALLVPAHELIDAGRILFHTMARLSAKSSLHRADSKIPVPQPRTGTDWPRAGCLQVAAPGK